MDTASYIATLAFIAFIIWIGCVTGMEWWKERRSMDKTSLDARVNQLQTEMNQLAIAVGLKRKMDPAMQAQLQAMQNAGMR